MDLERDDGEKFDEEPSKWAGESPDERPDEAALLAALPERLRHVRAQRELTRDALLCRGRSEEDPQLSTAVQRVWDAQWAAGRHLAEEYRALAELHAHEGEYEEVAEMDEVDTLRAALALRVTRSAASWRLRDAYQAVHLFPRAIARLEEGIMPGPWFQRLMKASRNLSDSSRRDLDMILSTWSMDISPERFFTLLRALVDHLRDRERTPDPVVALERSVQLLPGPEPGTGTLSITGPIPDVLARWKRLDDSARAIQAEQRAALRDGTEIPHDPDGIARETGRALPLSRLRYQLMDGAELDLDGVSVPAERFRLNVTVPALTLLGASDEPAMLDGATPLPATLARSLAGTADDWYRVLTDASSGAFLPLPAERYTPTPAMLEHLRLRHAQCAVPGCARPSSWASECDHIEECRRGTPGEGGLTEIENLHLLCWQHHLDKTAGLLDPTRIPTPAREPGRTRWRIGDSGDAVTAIDDLDTASLHMVDVLTAAWTSFLRGTRAGSAPFEPAPVDRAPVDPAPVDPAPVDPAPVGSGRSAPTLDPAPTGREDPGVEPHGVAPPPRGPDGEDPPPF
ncbi:HNH endonuclease signature motif containing protein [Brachybacterium saurashtrense]|uniref:HNH endonuclease n=1 Tax=Brachybacterium saurashtrense TaxID=556288 RepID=A0A345YQF4_9MICO|nr:HNH endonuclease signature motif containing protein [Brachybacterium saurashtrense]AXK46156.1 HNH endonuclease [Brachybacterium saurashtrense]RRR23896.1 HNH endonuclease [Brachybacterium saurashtrense]